MSAELTGGAAAGELVPVGDGPTGTVLAAVDTDTGQAYALKVLPGPPDDRTRDQFAREQGLLSALRGRAPVVVPDGLVRLDDGRWAVRRELCTQSLPELIAFSGPLAPADVVALARVLAEALAAVHRVGVVHGAVTPANVLFRPSGDAVLADAGLALRRSRPTDRPSGDDVRAPETILGGHLDERSDLYGLGAVLHFAATGRPPFPADDSSGPPPAPPGELLSALLNADPARRPPNAATVATHLRSPSLPSPSAQVRGASLVPEVRGASLVPEVRGVSVVPEVRGVSVVPEVRGVSVVPEVPVRGVPAGVGVPGVAFPAGGPLLEFGPARPRQRRGRRLSRWSVLVGAGVVLVSGIVLSLGPARPDALPVGPPPARPVPPVAVPPVAVPPVAVPPVAVPPVAVPPVAVPHWSTAQVGLVLAAPTDRGNYVDLAWTSSAALDFAIIVDDESEPKEVVIVQRVTRYRVPVDPRQRYCFTVQGTDVDTVIFSAPQPIRGARCGRLR